MFAEDLESFQQVEDKEKLVFFDRGFLDSLAYSRLMSLPIEKEMLRIASQHRYHQKVFVFPPWKEIYRNDSERKQSYEEAVATYERIVEVYLEFGYELIEVPKTDVNNRVEFILNQITRSEII